MGKHLTFDRRRNAEATRLERAVAVVLRVKVHDTKWVWTNCPDYINKHQWWTTNSYCGHWLGRRGASFKRADDRGPIDRALKKFDK